MNIRVPAVHGKLKYEYCTISHWWWKHYYRKINTFSLAHEYHPSYGFNINHNPFISKKKKLAQGKCIFTFVAVSIKAAALSEITIVWFCIRENGTNILGNCGKVGEIATRWMHL